MEKNNKISNILIIVIIILVVLLAGFILYDKLLKQDNSSNQGAGASINSYQTFSANLKKQILAYNIRSYLAEDSEYTSDITYKVILTNKMELIMIFNNPTYESKYGEIKIADNVINFAIAQTGPGAYKNIYFIKEDGTVGEAVVWDLFMEESKNKMTINYPIAELKNIVSIVQTSSQELGYMLEPAFIDINGNVHTNVIPTYWD